MFGLEQLGLLGLFIGCFLAATVLPFSSDALYVAVLLATKDSAACLISGTAGNWAGGVTTYYLGRCTRWEWIEKVFHVKRETLEKQKALIDRWGVWVALASWVPFIGDVLVIALGVYRSPALWTLILLLAGKLARFAAWTVMIM